MKIKNLLILNAIIFSSIIVNAVVPSLSSVFQTTGNGAGVLAYTYWPEKKADFFVLSKEAHGKDKGTYDAFGGGKDPNELHPIHTASRELFEESIKLLGDIQYLKKYIDIDSSNTKNILVNKMKNSFLYITKFDFKPIEKLIKEFPIALKKATQAKFKEKEEVVLVDAKDLEKSIVAAKGSINVHVNALKYNNKTKHYDNCSVKIRPYLARILGHYFNNEHYVSGKNPKIRFY